MKLRGALKLLRLFFFPEAACDVAERSVCGICRRRCGINGGPVDVSRDSRTGDGVLRLWCIGWSSRRLIFARFQLGAIVRSKDGFTLQVFSGVDVLGFFLLVLFAGPFLTGSFRNVLVFPVLLRLRLGAASRCAKKNEGRNQNSGHTAT